MAKKTVRVDPSTAGKAVSKALSERGGSAFKLTTGQRKKIVRDSTSGNGSKNNK